MQKDNPKTIRATVNTRLLSKAQRLFTGTLQGAGSSSSCKTPAGLEPWPKTFQNLRSTRETELAEQYPIHVVCKWIGNSAAIAATHYLQLTDEHFARATGENCTSEAAQNPTQKLQESARNGQNDQQGQDDENPSNAGDFKKKRLNAGDCERRLMTPTGFEPVLPG